MEKEIIIKAEERQLRFLIRDFVELQKLLRAVKDTEKHLSHQSVDVIKDEINKILKSLKGGLFSGEERIEYKMARHFQRLREIIIKVSAELNYQEHQRISTLLQKAYIYNAELEKLGSRGGEIERGLEEAKNDPTNREKLRKIEVLIEQALQADRAFEAVIRELLVESKKIKVLKSRILVSEHIERLALVVETTEKTRLILYDQVKLDSIYRDFRGLMSHPDLRELREYEKGITAQVFDSHYERNKKLSYVEDRLMKESVIGYGELVGPYPKVKFCGAYEIFRIAALKGFGPFLFEMVFAYASQYKHPVVLDRKDISPAARKVWEYFDTNRKFVIAYPAALSKYPELVGFTKEEALETFGSAGIFSSTFDQFGYPANTPSEKKEKLMLKYQDERFDSQYSFIKKEGSRETNLAVGSLASLDKAFYYDGEIHTFKELVAKGKEESSLRREQLGIAGEIFFQTSKSRTG